MLLTLPLDDCFTSKVSFFMGQLKFVRYHAGSWSDQKLSFIKVLRSRSTDENRTVISVNRTRNLRARCLWLFMQHSNNGRAQSQSRPRLESVLVVVCEHSQHAIE